MNEDGIRALLSLPLLSRFLNRYFHVNSYAPTINLCSILSLLQNCFFCLVEYVYVQLQLSLKNNTFVLWTRMNMVNFEEKKVIEKKIIALINITYNILYNSYQCVWECVYFFYCISICITRDSCKMWKMVFAMNELKKKTDEQQSNKICSLLDFILRYDTVYIQIHGICVSVCLCMCVCVRVNI